MSERCQATSSNMEFREHDMLSVEATWKQLFQKYGNFGFKFGGSIKFSIIIIIAITMNNQSWKFAGLQLGECQLKNPLKQSQILEGFLTNCGREQMERTISISNFLELSEEAQFLVKIAKFTKIFNVSTDLVDKLENLSPKKLVKIKQYIEDKNAESVVADTNRNKFETFFKKVFSPPLGLPATLTGSSVIFLIIQNLEQQQQKCQIKILNWENFMFSVTSNVSLGKGFEQLEGIFSHAKYKNITSLVCFEKNRNKNVNSELFKFLARRFQEVFYTAINGEQVTVSIFEQFMATKIEDRNIHVKSSKNQFVLQTHQLSREHQAFIHRFYVKHARIDGLIMDQVRKSPLIEQCFSKNQLCVKLYGLYYNFASLNSLDEAGKEEALQSQFLMKFISEMCQCEEQKKKTKNITRKLGHYPKKISFSASKICCVCSHQNEGQLCSLSSHKKTRYKCQKCSETYSKDIPICIDHFKEYHYNMARYIPKGVKKGAHRNQIMQFKEEAQREEIQKTENCEARGQDEDVEGILGKWAAKAQQGFRSIGTIVTLVLRNQFEYGMAPFFSQDFSSMDTRQKEGLIAKANYLGLSRMKMEHSHQVKREQEFEE